MTETSELSASAAFKESLTDTPDNKVAIGILLKTATITLQGTFKISTITSTWPSDDSFAIIPSKFQNIRSFRLKAYDDGSAISVCRYAIDADNESLAEHLLTSTPSDPNTQPQTFGELIEGVWSDWIDLSDLPDLPPLLRVDFKAAAATDSFTVIMETR